MFSGVSHAYDILKGNVSRRDYDYALKHPEKFAYNHYRYYRGKALRSMRVRLHFKRNMLWRRRCLLI